jgi:16S rRNA G966 N2-methylase RsmD
MDLTFKKGIIKVNHKLKRNQIYKIKNTSKFLSLTIMNKPQICVGFSSRTDDNKDILLLDYDNCVIDVVKEDVKYIQENYNVSHAYLLTTKQKKKFGEYVGNYHVIFLSKHSPSEIVEILKNTHVDLNYIDSPIRTKYRSYVLRLSTKKGSKKPKFLSLIENNRTQKYIISSSHKKLLKEYYPKIIHPSYKEEDNLKGVRIQEYETF